MGPTKQFEIETDEGGLLGPRIGRSSKWSPEREVSLRLEGTEKEAPLERLARAFRQVEATVVWVSLLYVP